jgi:hypothetical protein
VLKTINEISEQGFQIRAELEGLKNSLQKEFEFLLASEAQDFVKVAKTRQVNSIDYLTGSLTQMIENVQSLENLQFKLEACAVHFGVSFAELKQFLNQPLKVIQAAAKQATEGNIQVPFKIQSVLSEEKINQLHFTIRTHGGCKNTTIRSKERD